MSVEAPSTMNDTKHDNSSSDPIPVTDELIRIYEQSSKFSGIGAIMLRAGLWTLVDDNPKTPAVKQTGSLV